MAHYSIQMPYVTSSLNTLTASVAATVAIPRNDLRGTFMLSLATTSSLVAYIGLGYVPSSTQYSFYLRNGDVYTDDIGFRGNVYATFDGNSGATYLQATEFLQG